MSRLFTLTGARRRHPDVHHWLDTQPPALRDLAADWFQALRECGPDVVELLHDGQATACVGEAAFAYVDVFTAHVNVGFFRGAFLPDPAGLLQGTGKFMRHVKLRPEVAVNESALLAVIQAAYDDISARVAEADPS